MHKRKLTISVVALLFGSLFSGVLAIPGYTNYVIAKDEKEKIKVERYAMKEAVIENGVLAIKTTGGKVFLTYLKNVEVRVNIAIDGTYVDILYRYESAGTMLQSWIRSGKIIVYTRTLEQKGVWEEEIAKTLAPRDVFPYTRQ